MFYRRATRSISVFALQEYARSLQRHLVWCSDRRGSLGGSADLLSSVTQYGSALDGDRASAMMRRKRLWRTGPDGDTRFEYGFLFSGVLQPATDSFRKFAQLETRKGVGSDHSDVDSLIVRRPPQSRQGTCAALQQTLDALRSSGKAEGEAKAEEEEDDDSEFYVEPTALSGLLPRALISAYNLWRVGRSVLRGDAVPQAKLFKHDMQARPAQQQRALLTP